MSDDKQNDDSAAVLRPSRRSRSSCGDSARRASVRRPARAELPDRHEPQRCCWRRPRWAGRRGPGDRHRHRRPDGPAGAAARRPWSPSKSIASCSNWPARSSSVSTNVTMLQADALQGKNHLNPACSRPSTRSWMRPRAGISSSSPICPTTWPRRCSRTCWPWIARRRR